MSVPSVNLTFIVPDAFAGLSSAGAGSDRVGHAFPLPMPSSDREPGNGAATCRTHEEVS